MRAAKQVPTLTRWHGYWPSLQQSCPVMNYVLHGLTVRRVYYRLLSKGVGRETLIQFAAVGMVFVIFLNGIWVMVIVFIRFDAETYSEEWITFNNVCAFIGRRPAFDNYTFHRSNRGGTDRARLFFMEVCFLSIFPPWSASSQH